MSRFRARLGAALATITALIALTAATTWAAPPIFKEEFNYNPATQLNGQNGWSAHSGAGTNPIMVVAGNLSYPNYQPCTPTGNMVSIAGSGEDDNRGFTGITSGTAYAALLINVSLATTTGDYCFHFFDQGIATNGFFGRLFIKKDAASSNYAFGTQFKSKTGATCTVYQAGFPNVYGTTHLIVIRYKFNAGLVNDEVAMFIDPVVSCTEPNPDLVTVDGGPSPGCTGTGDDFDAVNIDGVAIRQGGASSGASALIDGIRVGTNWAETVAGSSTVTTSSVGGGSISPAGPVQLCDGCPNGGSQKFTISAAPCFTVTSVKLDGVELGAGTTSVVVTATGDDADHTISATFAPANIPTTTVLNVAPSPSVCGEKVVLTAQVSPTGAAGVVIFTDNGNPIGGPVAVDPAGNASVSTASLDPGSHSLLAAYVAEPCYTSSTSNKVVHQVNQTPTSLSIAVYPPTSNCGDDITISGYVTPLGATGTVQFFDGGNPIDGPVPLDGTGYAYLTVTNPAGESGTHSITAEYSGDPCYLPSTGDKVSYVVDCPTPTLLSMFRAEPTGDGIELKWQFVDPSELGDVSLERADAAAGPWAAIAADRQTVGNATVVVDHGALAGHRYFYRLSATVRGGSRITMGLISATGPERTTEFALTKIAPNPTVKETEIDYAVAKETRVQIAVVDLQGRVVAQLVDGMMRPGRYQAVWTGQANRGLAPAGLYFVRYQAAGKLMMRRLVVTR